MDERDFAIGPGETVVWTGRPRPLAGPPLRVLPVLVVAGTGTLIAWLVTGQALAVPVMLGFWAIVLVGPGALRFWRLHRTRYALTQRSLYTRVEGPRGRSTVLRLTALRDLVVTDESPSIGSIALRPPPGIERLRAPGWLLPNPDVVLVAIPDARAVKSTIDELREAETASGTPGTPIAASPRPSSRVSITQLVVALGWLVISSVVIVAIWSSSGPDIPALAIPVLFFVGGLVMLVAPFVRRGDALDRAGQLGVGTVTDVRGSLQVGEDGPDGVIDYRYEVTGRTYTGRVAGLPFEEARRVGIGDLILIRFDPADPKRSIWAVG